MIVYPNAKINLGLNIVEKRPDGYHNIETLFYPISLSDTLEIVFPDDVTDYVFQSSGIALDVEAENNICIKALRKLQSVRELPGVGIHLHKNIPSGAGLGGGSADAAFLMKNIDELLELGIGEEELCRLSAKIGADCPFFVVNKPAFATGIGDVLTPVDIDLKGMTILLVKPNIHVPTKDAYSLTRPRKPAESIMDIVHRPVSEWRDRLVNDFEESVFVKYPGIGDIKQRMYDKGAVYASMSGSGSSVFGLFDHDVEVGQWDADAFVWKGVL